MKLYASNGAEIWKMSNIARRNIWLQTWLWSRLFHHLGLLLCQLCLIPICPSKIGQALEQPRSWPKVRDQKPSHIYRWSIWSWTTFCWHWFKCCILVVWGDNTVAEFSISFDANKMMSTTRWTVLYFVGRAMWLEIPIDNIISQLGNGSFVFGTCLILHIVLQHVICSSFNAL